ncbi:uncharacterized protein LOC119403379 [Rhipicephalus sanguineus]|uniref:uncharacterized protein LOC119403379 n=1 Tax=Rhipicephalus sanguineus TaxID=34632 RepID=UPI0018930422|nr:uncharacterized protein LOC119403379 [Rhipicephalus sanguineus]
MLHSGSQRSFIRTDVAKRLQCKVIGTEELSLVTFGNAKPRNHLRCRRVSVTLRGRFNGSTVTLEALEVPEVCTVTSPPLNIEVLELLSARRYDAADMFDPETWRPEDVSILIGSDAYWKVATGKIDRLNEQLTAVETSFGWTVQGSSSHYEATATSALFLSAGGSHQECNESAMWRLDTIGSENRWSSTVKDNPDLDIFEHCLSKQAGRYQVPLMMQEPGIPAGSDNRQLAACRLNMQLNRFREQPDLLKQYDEAITAYFKDGHAERVDQEQIPGPNIYYMPHHAVIRRDAVTTKLRVVFDASSHVVGKPCLNDVLSKGVKLGVDIVQLLLSFRCYPVILVADIKKAYLQMLIRPEDRDLLRFLWVQQLPTKEEPSPPIVAWRMTRVPFGAASSPFLLAATIRHHLASCREKFPVTVSLLEKAFYVDDLILGVSTAEQAMTVYQETRAIFADACMELRKWASNSDLLKQQFIQDNVAIETEAGDDHLVKVLGLPWERKGDTIALTVRNAASFAANRPATKRTILQTVASVYDPLGYLSPFTVKGKLIFQDLWKRKHSWDDTLPDEVQAAWNAWCTELPDVQAQVPRYVFLHDCSVELAFELLIFNDASPKAYGACIYVRALSADGACVTRLLISRSRVAPLKTMSLPRLELMACVSGARLAEYVWSVPRLQQASAHFWTDSLVALHWIRAKTRNRSFHQQSCGRDI